MDLLDSPDEEKTNDGQHESRYKLEYIYWTDHSSLILWLFGSLLTCLPSSHCFSSFVEDYRL